jgi:Tfp pilus assembly protein PilX
MRERSKILKIEQESGVALVFALLALLLLSAIAASLVLMTNTETAVNSNYRRERVADFAAKAGFEEVRDRMMASNPASINANLPVSPPPGNNTVLYLLNEGNAPGTVKPWVAGNAYMDDELCHDGYNFPGQQGPAASDVRCTTVPNNNYSLPPVNSTAPYSGTSAAIPYKWVRVAMKVNDTVQGIANTYWVNPAQPATTQVCWNGATEILLSGAATCQTMAQLAVPVYANPVYVITSLGVSGSGTRKMVQAEVALDPLQPFPYGLYATGTACPALTMVGNALTDSFTTANGGSYGTTHSNQGGDVGSNGGVSLNGNATIGGAIGVQNFAPSPPTAPAPCVGAQGDYSATGNAGWVNLPGNGLQTIPTYTFSTPPDPVPLPPNTPYAGGLNLVPGTYGNITLAGKQTLTLAPGTYNIYSLTMSGQSSIVVNPPGAVVLNFPSASATPINFSGQSLAAPSQIANDFQINYAGTGVVSLSGQANSYINVNAPRAAVQVTGQGDIFGRVVGQTLTWTGNGKFHFDKNSGLGPQSNGIYRVISFRDVAY